VKRVINYEFFFKKKFQWASSIVFSIEQTTLDCTMFSSNGVWMGEWMDEETREN